jgi:hypothetical protein
MPNVAFRPLFTIHFETTPQVVGDVPLGYFRRAGIITSGSFAGERLSGRVLPGGGDWLTKRKDGVIHLDVRTILETERGAMVYMTYTGRLRMSAEAEARFARGEPLGPDDLYFRTAVQFETAHQDLLWLNDIVAFGIGERRPSGPTYHVHELL